MNKTIIPGPTVGQMSRTNRLVSEKQIMVLAIIRGIVTTLLLSNYTKTSTLHPEVKISTVC